MESAAPVYAEYSGLDDHSIEDVDDYAPGGLHPTHLGDLLGDGRYKVILKLGHGGYGTVWLCRDVKEGTWRAVKILKASNSSEDCPDLRIQSAFSNIDHSQKDVRNCRVALALGHFWTNGPNGTHLCIVMPLLGPNLDNAAQLYLYDEAPLVRICFQLVQAMSFLHNKGVCHGDFRPHNACFTLKDIDNLEEDDIIQAFGKPKLIGLVEDEEFDAVDYGDTESDAFSDEESHESVRSDETKMAGNAASHYKKPQAHRPRYLVATSCINPKSPYVSNEVAVIDFGVSFLVSEPPEESMIPPHYGAPETFIDKCGDLGFGSDLWALGCTICEIRVGCEPFFDVGDIWHLMKYWENLNGPLPEPYRSSLAEDLEIPEDPEQYVSTDSEEIEELAQEHLRRTGVTGSLHNILLVERRFQVPLREGEEPSPPPPPTSSTRGRMQVISGHKIVAAEMTRREASELMELFKRIFAWKASERISASEILDLPYFAACRAETEGASESQQMSGENADVDSASQAGADATVSWHGDSGNEALVPLGGIGPLLALLRELLRPCGL
ncbi:hypothetical protein KVR01_006215 [Diaporthe batatas]|uniref:uncharacterized protein n=1 Tax=Diaporthe batatas TaxID=748121 RepID=UPI001D04BDCB|nr:uncharacterized protein KVR01_006215 [Diaporthe batatas]KAG8164297.1 hypothetical protein KVR01_006215 [Diaporthe batatas]